jgi:adenosylcobinamide amidohydrolase
MNGEPGLLLADSEGFALSRSGRFLAARLKSPHLVLSTSQVNGGEQKHLGYLANHQSCEGKGHMGRHHDLAISSREEYHRAVCGEAGLPPERTALMGTAANMQNAALAVRSFEEITVWAAVTAGVQGNAGRAGDPARWHEGTEGWKPLQALPGTINTLLLFNWPLLPGALARAVATMTEAKSAVLLELAVGSRYSPHLATGTGTDQYCLACPLDPVRKPKTWTGKHSRLGEILALAVMDALRDALRWQNGLEPSRTRNLAHALARFGITEDGLRAAMALHLGEKDRELLANNFLGVLHEPQVAGAAYALAAVQDRIAYGVLPDAGAAELLLNQAALMAAALAARPGDFPRFRAALAAEAAPADARMRDVPSPGEAAAVSASASGVPPLRSFQSLQSLQSLIARALALGWAAKWE